MEPATNQFVPLTEQTLGAHFNPRSRLATGMRTDGYLILSEYHTTVPAMVGAIRVTRARDGAVWERHDRGDEVLVLLSGACTMTLRDAEGRMTEQPMSPGDVLVIPKGVAHHGTLHSDEIEVLFVTPRTGTKEWAEGEAKGEVER